MIMNLRVYREFAAMQYYQVDCRRKGNIPLRWRVLREDIRQEFLKKADEMVGIWEEQEQAAEERRNSFPFPTNEPPV